MSKDNTFYKKGSGFSELVTQFQANNGQTNVFVGFLRSSGSHKAKKGKKILTVATIAANNEYGSGTTPERSFMRSTMFDIRKKLKKMLLKLAKAVLHEEMDKKKALGLVGLFVQTAIKRKIQEGIPPPNADSTIAQKGSDHTLIDTGQMRDSVDFEIKEGKR